MTITELLNHIQERRAAIANDKARGESQRMMNVGADTELVKLKNWINQQTKG